MTYILDSDMLIYYINQVAAGEAVTQLLEREATIVISIVSIMEFRAGLSEEKVPLYMPQIYQAFPVEPITPAIAERAGMLRYQGKLEGRKPKPMDSLIAAAALEHDYCLITNNQRDYTMSGLHIYNNVVR